MPKIVTKSIVTKNHGQGWYRSHDQIPASHWSSLLPYHMVVVVVVVVVVLVMVVGGEKKYYPHYPKKITQPLQICIGFTIRIG